MAAELLINNSSNTDSLWKQEMGFMRWHFEYIKKNEIRLALFSYSPQPCKGLVAELPLIICFFIPCVHFINLFLALQPACRKIQQKDFWADWLRHALGHISEAKDKLISLLCFTLIMWKVSFCQNGILEN